MIAVQESTPISGPMSLLTPFESGSRQIKFRILSGFIIVKKPKDEISAGSSFHRENISYLSSGKTGRGVGYDIPDVKIRNRPDIPIKMRACLHSFVSSFPFMRENVFFQLKKRREKRLHDIPAISRWGRYVMFFPSGAVNFNRLVTLTTSLFSFFSLFFRYFQ